MKNKIQTMIGGIAWSLFCGIGFYILLAAYGV